MISFRVSSNPRGLPTGSVSHDALGWNSQGEFGGNARKAFCFTGGSPPMILLVGIQGSLEGLFLTPCRRQA